MSRVLLLGILKRYNGNGVQYHCRAMETTSLSYPSSDLESTARSREWVFLTLLLNPCEDSPAVVAAGASRSNLFFSSMYGASAKPNFGLKPRNK